VLEHRLESGDKQGFGLKPLGICATAGSAGNIIAALQTLPKTEAVERTAIVCSGGRLMKLNFFVDGIRGGNLVSKY
jgi:hypothetical protein